MRPPEMGKYLVFGLLFILYTNAEVCPVENPTEGPTPESNLGPAKRLMLKQKTCPDFKDDADQSHCCPSRITFGSFYCCTLEQKHEIQSEIASERRRQFVKKYLAVIIITTITLFVMAIVGTSIICKRVRCCPLHHSKGSYSRSSTSFQIPSTHSAMGGSRYQPVQTAPLSNNQARHSGTFTSINSTTPPQTNKTLAYDVEMTPRPALIWDYYVSKDKDGKRKCKYCDQKEDNSSNAEKHTKRNYAEEFKEFEVGKVKSPSRKRPAETVPSAKLPNLWKSKLANNWNHRLSPPPYESHDTYRAINEQPPVNASAQFQHQYNRVLENELNNMLSQNDHPTPPRNGEFVRVPPPANLNYPDTLHNVD